MQSRTIPLRTSKREEVLLITRKVEEALREAGADGEGICTLITPHTSAALTINENADPAVQEDLLRAFKALVPAVRFDHGEGNSDAHLLCSLLGVSIQLPYRKGKLLLGKWQGIWFVELDGPRTREVTLHVP